MNNIITEDQIDKVIKPYWDLHFDDSELTEYDSWSGLFKKSPNRNAVLLVGYPSNNAAIWYINGEYFNGGWHMFNIQPNEFNKSMVRYINNRFKINIRYIL